MYPREQMGNNDEVVSRLAREDNIPWYNKPNLRLLYLLMVPTCLGVEMTSGFDSSMTNGLQAVPSWLEYFHHPHSVSLGLVASMYSLGGIAVVPLVPFVVDKSGRRYPILPGGIISIVGGILQGFATTFTMFLIGRFILGFANVLCIIAASSLVGELSHPKERVVISCLFNSSAAFGSMIAAAVTLGTFAMPSDGAWRIPSLLQLIPSLLQVLFISFMPESPRWLVSKGRGSDAYAILVKYHGEGEESEFVRAEYSQIKQTLEAELKFSQMSRRAVFSTPGMRKRVIITTFLGLFTQWCGKHLLSSYLVLVLDNIGIHDNRTKNIMNLARVSWSCLNGTAISLMVPQYPRRKIYIACTISVFVVFTAFTAASAEYALTHNKIIAQVVLALIFLYDPAYNLGFVALTYSFLVELFPFHARTGGIAMFQWWSRCASFVGQLVNPIGMDAAGWRWYIVYCVWDAFQIAFVYLMFPETSGRTLEELAFLYEDDQEILHRRMEAGTYGTMDSEDRART